MEVIGEKKGGLYSKTGDFSNIIQVNNNEVWHKGNLKIACGSGEYRPSSAGAIVSGLIDISSYGFTKTPVVFANACSSSTTTAVVNATNASTTQFQLYGTRTNGTAPFSTNWLAIGI